MLMSACRHPDDATMREHFSRNKSALSRIVQMAHEDSHLYRVAKDFTWPTGQRSPQEGEPGLTPQRWEAYRKLFDEAEVPQGFIRVNEAPGRLLLIVTTVPGGTKGYAYCPTPPDELVASLDTLPKGKGQWRGFVRIEEPWYLFREVDIQ
jgi:hypothetical protein